jgi:uncharacterized protein (DUF488 family)
MATLHTIGYEKRDLRAYIAALCDAAITLVVDVRETAWSHKPGFSKTAFAAALAEHGIAYVHARFAGNPKTLRDQARTHAECLRLYHDWLSERPEIVEELDAVVAGALACGDNVALTCFERHHHDCHRSILADAWQSIDPSRDVEHLAHDGCMRLIPT